MSQLKRYCEQIGRILNDYKSFLNQEAKASLYDNHKYSEYLFKQLLNLVYNWDLKHTEEKYLTNTSGIDLFSSRDGGYSVQITAQNNGQDKKVTDTILDYKDKWKVKYQSLKILFIQGNVDNLRKKYNTTDKLVEVLSFKELLRDIKNLDDLKKVKKIIDFLRQELGNELNYDRPLKGFKHFEEKMKGKIFYSISNTEAFNNGLLYYTNYEELLIEKLGGIFEEKNKKALIEGPPCSGKTSLLFGLNATLDKKLIKCFYVNLEEWSQEYEAETIYFKGIDSLLIIDNAHIDRYEIAKNIYQICDENKINVLFISRDNNSQKLLNSSLNRFDFDVLESFTTAYDKDEQIKLKIEGIVENRLSYLRRVKPDSNWSVGDIEVVLKNSELSLLKTTILLNYWEQKYSNKQLQDVLDYDCYKEFFNEHIHKKMDYEVVFKYSSIYKFECPFKLINISDTIQQQIDNGIFIDTKRNLLYKFPHTEYAQLLSKSIKFERNIDNRYETAQILKYIIETKPENIHVLIEGLLNGKYYAHLDFILSDYNSSNFIFNHYSTRKDNIDLKLLLFGLNEISKELSNENSKSFVTRLIESLQDFNLVSYEKAGEEIIEKANEVADFYKITQKPRYRNIDGSNRFRSKSFFELSELITKNRKNRPFVTKIALSLKYSEWKTKFEQYDGNYSKKIEGIANLNKEPITRQLAFDLYELLDTNEIFRKLEDSSIDVFGKAINNLSNFYNIDGRKKPKELLRLFKKKEKYENQTQYGLSKYAIGLSHINKIDNDYIQELYPGDNEIIKLFSDASANDLAQRIPLFIKCFPSKNENFISIIRSKLSNDSFYSQQNNNLQGFTELAHVISKQKYPFTKEELKKLTLKIVTSVSIKNSLTELSSATQVLGKNVNHRQIHSLITPERISNELENEKIKLTDLETILTKNLKEKIAVEIYTKIDNEILRQSCLRNDISFEQSTKVLMQLSNREFNYDKNKRYSKKILHELFTINKTEFTKKIKSSNIQDFLTGYVRLYNIDNVITEGNLLELVKKKSLLEHKEATLSTASQSFKNIASLASTNKIYKKISDDFITHSYNSLIENSNGIDVGQISDGLKELSIEHPVFAEKFLKDLLALIKIKCLNERDRNDFSTRIIPQLQYAAGDNKELINEIERLK